MRLRPHLRRATFVTRLNRFAALMRVDGRETLVHVANSGRLKELLRPENPMILAPAPTGGNRKTAYDLALVELDGVLVSADARLPNGLLAEAIEAGRLPEFAGYEAVQREVTLDDSRIDLLLSGRAGRCYIEVKSVTLVDCGAGLFPDAPTERGRKHVETLARAVGEGHRAAVVFVIQRSDAREFRPNEDADPRFCQVLRRAVRLGLEAYAYRCRVDRTRIDIWDAVPVHLAPADPC